MRPYFTFERAQSRQDYWMAFAGGFLSASAIYFFFNPRRGKAHRHMLKDKAFSAVRMAEDRAIRRSYDIRQRMQGRMYEMRHADEKVSDDLLVERVRAQLGKPVSNPSAIQVSANDGVVTLSGSILAGEADNLIGICYKVRGVRRVVDELKKTDTVPVHQPLIRRDEIRERPGYDEGLARLQ